MKKHTDDFVIIKNLNSLISSGKFDNTKIICFGNNKSTAVTVRHLIKSGYNVEVIFDNKEVCGDIEGVPLSIPYFDRGLYNAIVLIGSKYYNEMCTQLLALGYNFQNIYCTIQYNNDIYESIDIYTLVSKTMLMFKALKFRDRILNRYGKNTIILVSPAKSIGDAYLALSYMNTFLSEKGITDYLFIVNGKAAFSIKDLFPNVLNVIVLDEEEIAALVRISRFLGEKESQIIILNERHNYTNYTKNMIGCGGYTNFSLCYKVALFQIDRYSISERPQFSQNELLIQRIFETNNLKENNTVVLSPYSNYLHGITLEKWELIARKLIDLGFCVCTNIVEGKEVAIRGTVGVCCEIIHVGPFLSKAGYFVGVRNGLTDIISTISVKKIVIYSREKESKFYSSNQYYSLKFMGLSDDTFEIIDSNTIVDDVVNILLSFKEIEREERDRRY